MSVIFEPSSFRDNDGFIFYKDRTIYRSINSSYKNVWDQLSTSDFFLNLIMEHKLVDFSIVNEEFGKDIIPKPYKVIQVQKIPFISYPNEWTFSKLKKAALLTLSIQKQALLNNFTLKDASAYNVQFIGNKAIFIDTLSFEIYQEGSPWQAYKQFCQHFLGPLLLWQYGLKEIKSLFIDNIDGIPLTLCSKLLPFTSRFNFLAYTHIHLHAKFESKHATDKNVNAKKLTISKSRVLSMIEHLEQGIKSMKEQSSKTNWTDYYDSFSYSEAGYSLKKNFVEKHLSKLKGDLCVDLGANTGEFSVIAATHFKNVVACDSDLEVVTEIQRKKIPNILALHNNLINPTPAFGWNNTERKSFIERINVADATLALALIHHLCIGNNIPLTKLARFFADISNNLILEFVPRTDVQVQKLLVTKKDIFQDYTLENFNKAFSHYFKIEDSLEIPDSNRVIFLLKKGVGNG